VGEKFEMMFYQFVRFTPQSTINAKALKQHRKFIQSLVKGGGAIHQGNFGDKEGGILVLKADAAKETVEADQAVKEGVVKYEMKKLYIAKGSFCEK
jgi:hypothetical protein